MTAQTTENEVDTHDPAGMAQWLRERRDAALEFYKLDSEAQQRHFLQRWQQHVLPHLAFRFGQAAEMIESLQQFHDWALPQITTHGEDQVEIERLRAALTKLTDPNQFSDVVDMVAVARSALDVRVPLPPDVLVDASPDRVHTESGPARAGRSVKVDVPADCPHCDGAGHQAQKKCVECDGTGKQQLPR